MQIKNKFNIGDIVLTKSNGTGKVKAINILVKEDMHCVQYSLEGFNIMFFYEEDLKLIKGRNDMKQCEENKIYFSRYNEEVKLPSKRNEDAGYDIYAYLRENETIALIPSHETQMIPTGLKSAFNERWYVQLQERGSTGTKGIAQRCGVIDSGYRGEWMIPITNTTEKLLVISKVDEDETRKLLKKANVNIDNGLIIYPYSKAICQAVILEVPKLHVEEVSIDELNSFNSERGEGKLGSSSK